MFFRPVDTGTVRDAIPDPAARRERLMRVATGRFGTIGEMVAAVLFVASDRSWGGTGSGVVVNEAGNRHLTCHRPRRAMRRSVMRFHQVPAMIMTAPVRTMTSGTSWNRTKPASPISGNCR